MKNIKAILSGLIGFFLIYLLTAFVNWQFNASKWSTDARFFTASIGFLVFLVCFGAYISTTDGKSN